MAGLNGPPRTGAPRRLFDRLPRAVLEGTFLVLVVVSFSRLHDVVVRDATVAMENARVLQSLEQRLHLDVELAANRWLVEHEVLITPAVLVYRLYYVVLLAVLIRLLVRHPDLYRRARSTFVVMACLALVVFWSVPVAPPRFALPGVVDLVVESGILTGPVQRTATSSANLTAMPSLHVGWSAWCAYWGGRAEQGTHPRRALLAWLFPAAMTVVVVATGNHYLLDVVGSVVLLAVSVLMTAAWSRIVAARGSRSRPAWIDRRRPEA